MRPAQLCQQLCRSSPSLWQLPLNFRLIGYPGWVALFFHTLLIALEEPVGSAFTGREIKRTCSTPSEYFISSNKTYVFLQSHPSLTFIGLLNFCLLVL